jgi:hypothetical protein
VRARLAIASDVAGCQLDRSELAGRLVVSGHEARPELDAMGAVAGGGAFNCALRADSTATSALATLVVQLGLRDGTPIEISDDLPAAPPPLAMDIEKSQQRALAPRALRTQPFKTPGGKGNEMNQQGANAEHVFARPLRSAPQQLASGTPVIEKQTFHELPAPTGKPPFRLKLEYGIETVRPVFSSCHYDWLFAQLHRKEFPSLANLIHSSRHLPGMCKYPLIFQPRNPRIEIPWRWNRRSFFQRIFRPV